ncbi:MAG: metallophosphoesterase [Planctomycetota bacterium]|jgi:hypothetical protein
MSDTPLYNLSNADDVCELFDAAAVANRTTPTRVGSIVKLGATGRLLVSGDLHDNGMNFQKVVKLARLSRSPDHHVVLQETIHGDSRVNGMDLSYRTLARIAMLKLEHPEQVHHILSNHELSQVYGPGILKDSVNQVEAFSEGLSYVFQDDTDRVNESIARYITSLPLAVRCDNGVLCSHSLPTLRKLKEFDFTVLDRDLNEADLTRPAGSAFLMTWGRGFKQELADRLAEKWGVDLFVLGHEHAEMGYEVYGDTMIVVNSDHGHGVALPIDLSKRYHRDDLAERVHYLAAVELG